MRKKWKNAVKGIFFLFAIRYFYCAHCKVKVIVPIHFQIIIMLFAVSSFTKSMTFLCRQESCQQQIINPVAVKWNSVHRKGKRITIMHL